MTNILIIEDDQDIADLLKTQLQLSGLTAEVVSDGESALSVIKTGKKYNLFLIDWMLPHVSGIELCKAIRSNPELKNSPIIMLTALTQPENIISGLDAGADDYITKPFDMEVLLARVRAQLRRSGQAETASKKYSYGELEVNLDKCQVLVQQNSVNLTNTEYQILCTLFTTPGKVFTRQQLIEQILGENVHVTSRTIDTHMAGLRRKLGPAGNYIETIRGIGYRFLDIEHARSASV